MTTKPSIKDVARRAMVSPATVSRVINGRAQVNPGIRDQVLAAVEALGYEPDHVAQSLRSRETRTIGVVITDVRNPVYARIMRGAEDAAHLRGYSVIICDTDSNQERETSQLLSLVRRRIDGIIIATCTEEPEILNVVNGTTVALIDRELPGVSLDSCLTDAFSGASEAVSHLIRLGHRRVGIISGPSRIRSGRLRLEGALSAVRSAGLPEIVRQGEYSEEDGYRFAFELLNRSEPPTAFFTCNNLILLGTLRAVRQLQIRLPDQLSLASFDDCEIADLYQPPITVVTRDAYKMGVVAVELLIGRIEHRRKGEDLPPRQVVFPTSLLIRGSCQEPPGARTV